MLYRQKSPIFHSLSTGLFFSGFDATHGIEIYSDLLGSVSFLPYVKK